MLINIPIENINRFDGIESIDQIIYEGNKNFENEGIKYQISSEEEFWAHASNLQVWVESNYDTRLLHNNLAFPLLKELVELGDLVAAKVFKEEIVKRFSSGL